MKVVRLLLMAGVVLLGETWATASTVPGDFTINLNNPGQSDLGGWFTDSGTPDSFGVTTYTTTQSGAGFTQTQFNCQEEDNQWQNGWNWWGWSSWDYSNFRNSNNGCDNDPYMLVTQAQHSSPLPGAISADGNGGGTQDYFVTQSIDAILFTVANFTPGQYFCDYVPGLAYEFDHCGFSTDSKGDLLILFWDNPGDSLSPVPEPSFGILSLIGFAAAAFAAQWIRSRRSAAA